MGSFEDALKNTLAGATQAFKTADENLHALVTEAGESVQRVTGGRATLVLARDDGHSILDMFRVDPTTFGAVYTLLLVDSSGAQGTKAAMRVIQSLGYYAISTSGYPIGVSAISPWDQRFQSKQLYIADRAALEKHFVEMATDRDSALVKQLLLLTTKRPS